MTAERRADQPDDGDGSDARGTGASRPEGGEAATYAVGGGLPVGDVEPGTNFLCLGPPMTGKGAVLRRVLGDGIDDGEGAIVVSTESDATRALRGDDRLEAAASRATPPVGVVDCVTQSAGGATPDDEVVAHVSSPADLTGIGVEFNRHLERFDAQELPRYRVLVDSLTPFFVYRDASEVFRFLQVLTGRIASLGGLGFAVAHTDSTEEEQLERVKGLFDGVIEFREGAEGGVEARARGPHATADGWVSLPGTGSDADPAPAGSPGGDGAGVAPGPGASPGGPAATDSGGRESPLAGGIDSLSAAIDAVTAGGRTLTVCNYEGDPGALSDLGRYFERMNVTVEEATTSTGAPSNVALLHQADQHLAAATVEDLASAVAVEGSDLEAPEGSAARDLLTLARQEAFAARNSWVDHLVRISRLVETMAWNEGSGTIHAGFQELSRLTDHPPTHRIYRRIADLGVEVHLYGAADADIDRERFTVHDDTPEEIERSWFVVYTDADEPDRAGALVAEERQRDTYTGFWTYDPTSVVAIRDYLEATYGT